MDVLVRPLQEKEISQNGKCIWEPLEEFFEKMHE